MIASGFIRIPSKRDVLVFKIRQIIVGSAGVVIAQPFKTSQGCPGDLGIVSEQVFISMKTGN
jgi:hypothetical protein